MQLNVSPTNAAAYREVAQEYLHYLHGRNPLSWVYLSNMGEKGANAGAEKSVMEFYHGWFADGSALYDGPNSTFGPAPGFVVGGPNQFYSGGVTPPTGEPPMKAYVDWNTAWPDSSWEVTENAVYYQAAYTLLASTFSSAAVDQAAPPTFSPPPGNYPTARTVAIRSATEGATIRYTLDGSAPSPTNGILYTGPVAIAATGTLRAIAYADGIASSAITTGNYVIGIPDTAYIYQDALASGWSDWSWSSTNNFANASPVYGGARSISANFTAGYAGFSLHVDNAVNAGGFEAVKFWINGGAVNKDLVLYTSDSDNKASPYFSFVAPAGVWTEISVPMSAIGSPLTIQRLTIHDSLGTNLGAFYLDDIRLEAPFADVVAPSLVAITINEGGLQRSMVKSMRVTFSESMDLIGQPIVIRDQRGGAVAGLTCTA